MVISIPTSLVIQGDDEQVGLFEIFQSLLAVSLVVDRIAEGARLVFKDSSLLQKALDVLMLPFKDLLDQVIQYKAMAARKGYYEAGGIFLALH